jgi:hypothetical protein
MTELELLATLAEDAPLPSADDLAAPRARLTAAIAAETGNGAARGRPGGRRHRRLMAAAAAAAVTVAAAAIAVAVALPGGSGAVQTAQLTAVQVLDRAASAALRQPAVVPLPSQFLYTKSVEFPSGTVENWRSIDGAGGEYVERGGKATRFGGGVPAYYPDMPTKASAMDAFLERTEGREMDDSDPRDLPKFIVDWVLQGYLRPAQQAALYKFFSTLPGLTVVSNARDVSGRPGVGVSWSTGGFTVMSIFDPQTFAYLGTTSWVGHTEYSGGSWAVVSTAIVDHAGELP